MDYQVPLLDPNNNIPDDQQEQELRPGTTSASASATAGSAAYTRPGDSDPSSSASGAAFGGADWRAKLASVSQRMRESSAELGKRVSEAATAVGSRLEEHVSVVGERVKDLVLPTTQADLLVDRATAEELLAPHWSTVLQISHLLQNGALPCGDVARALRRRLATRDSHVQLLALAVAESVVGSAPQVLGDIAREGVLSDMARIAVEPKTPARVRETVLRLIQMWAAPMEATRYFPAFEETFRRLKESGVTFPAVTAPPPQRTPQLVPFQSIAGRGAGRVHLGRPPSELPSERREVVAMPADFLAGPNEQARRTPHVRFVLPGSRERHREQQHHHHHNHHNGNELQWGGGGAALAAWVEAGGAAGAEAAGDAVERGEGIEGGDPKVVFTMARNAADLLTTMLTSAPAKEALKDEVVVSLGGQCRAAKRRLQRLLQQPAVLNDDSLLFDGLAASDDVDAALARVAAMRAEVKRERGKKHRKKGGDEGECGGEGADGSHGEGEGGEGKEDEEDDEDYESDEEEEDEEEGEALGRGGHCCVGGVGVSGEEASGERRNGTQEKTDSAEASDGAMESGAVESDAVGGVSCIGSQKIHVENAAETGEGGANHAETPALAAAAPAAMGAAGGQQETAVERDEKQVVF